MKKSEFIPASELPGYATERVRWEVDLPPYAPAENIGINIARLGKLAHGSGYNQITVVAHAGETTEYTPNVDSVNTQGSATASMRATVKKAPLADMQAADTPNALTERYYDYYWPNGTLRLNLSEITNKLSGGRKPGALRDPSAWAKQINNAAQEGIRNAATSNLITNAPRRQKMALIGIEAWFATLAALFNVGHPSEILPQMLQNNIFYQFAWDPLVSKFVVGLPYSERRLSFVPGLQMDRALAVNGLSRVMKLAKKI